jgi:predicted nuclease with TOPRIM domain
MERATLEAASREARNNLKALEKAPASADDLRKQLTGRLADLDKRFAEVTERIVRAELQYNETRVGYDNARREVRITEPLPRE